MKKTVHAASSTSDNKSIVDPNPMENILPNSRTKTKNRRSERLSFNSILKNALNKKFKNVEKRQSTRVSQSGDSDDFE